MIDYRLIAPSKVFEMKAFEYIQEFLKYNSEINGARGLRYTKHTRRRGHIGYSIRPTERKKGYGTLMLRVALEKCRELNLSTVLITCDGLNVESAKVIQNNNGILENEVFSETFSEIIQRYWINL
ncbi:GNAT family N-acetyltransferase [Clostridium sp. CS001]|uniref:GNAT family N-acetyltransferase n=1 Tax=Clostridium sp. CS001 TaxID=2880648 RepID=UPI001CF436EC|nr:GNAT family N-acetyltransferase [Clostridium sp. CS001]MCB2291539.1 GNAT family N-acetyltransferase [Clostridium sp. CS001]